jgi:aminomethyltransferase
MRSPLHDRHVAAGAVMTDFAGWDLPLRYTSETAEHHAVREGVGVFDLSHMGEISVTGRDAAEVLDATVVGDMGAVRVGRARYTVLCDGSGGVVDDLVVYRLADDDYLVVANAANVAEVVAALARSAGGRDVDVEDVTAATALIAVQGPASPAVLEACLSENVCGVQFAHRTDPGHVLALRRYGCARGAVAGVSAVIGRTGYTGEDGFEIYVPAGRASEVWAAVLAAGEPSGVVPAGLAARDTLRLEAGMALYGHELTRDTDPYEAGLARLVALDKSADFPGRAALEARERQDPARALVGLVAQGRRILRHGQPLTGPTSAGTVTSGAWSPTRQQSIALAYVSRADSRPGTVIEADVRGTRVVATVAELPFVQPFARRTGGSGQPGGPA